MRFARRSRLLGDTQLLENPALPMLEVNALYGDATLGQPIVLCSHDLENSQREGYDLAATLVALEVWPAPLGSGLWVEQVAWTQAPRLASVWCDQHDAGDWQPFVASELSHTLETHADVLAYLAYSGDNAVGMMIASSDGICGWWAGADDVANALFARGASDFGRLEVIVPSDRRSVFYNGNETGRFEVWLMSHQPSDAQTKPPSDP